MRQDYEKLFNQLKPALTPTGLFDQVVSRLGREQRLLSLRRRIALFTVSAVFSALALLPAGQAVWSGLSESGFTHFFSLIFSDAQIVLVYWQSFTLSLLESLPVVILISFFAVILVFLESLKSLTKDLKIFLNSKKLISR